MTVLYQQQLQRCCWYHDTVGVCATLVSWAFVPGHTSYQITGKRLYQIVQERVLPKLHVHRTCRRSDDSEQGCSEGEKLQLHTCLTNLSLFDKPPLSYSHYTTLTTNIQCRISLNIPRARLEAIGGLLGWYHGLYQPMAKRWPMLPLEVIFLQYWLGRVVMCTYYQPR